MLQFLFLLACTDTPGVQGRVVDIWNNPIEGATVIGAGERPLTDEHGVYVLKNVVPGSYEMRAGKEGYVQESAPFEVKAEERNGPTFRLYKKPPKRGFFAVTVGDYREIEPMSVDVIGHASAAVYGIEPPNERVFVEGEDVRIVYQNDLSLPQIRALGLKLKRLKFVETVKMNSVAGGVETEVPVNLFVSDASVGIDITPLKSRDHYVITPSEKLESGYVYALESQSLLNPTDAVKWSRIPATLRTVYPFTVK